MQFDIDEKRAPPKHLHAFCEDLLYIGRDGQWHHWSEVKGRLNSYLCQGEVIECSSDQTQYKVSQFGLELAITERAG